LAARDGECRFTTLSRTPPTMAGFAFRSSAPSMITLRLLSSRQTLLALAIAAAFARPVFAQEGAAPANSAAQATVYVSANAVNTLAPGAAPLDAVQPTSVIDERFIRDALRFNSNYDDIVKYAPSVTVTSPEGPGLGKNEGISIRGFQDGQFNITFDGIPFGDASDFHHTTSAYFSNHVLGQAQIDRGPGGGATIGNATFGGTLGLRSRDPSTVDGVSPYLTLGSWNTRAGGVAIDHNFGDTGVFVEASRETSDTFLSETKDRRSHFFLKTISQLTDTTALTFVSGFNHEKQNTVQGATLAQIAAHGWSTGLGDDPTLQTYAGYNNATYRSSFNYLGLTSRVGAFDVDNKVYFNNFDHWSHKTTDPTDDVAADNGVQFYGSTGAKTTKVSTDVPGKEADARFHAIGDVLRLSAAVGPGRLAFGGWFERNIDDRVQKPVDMSTGAETGTKYGNTDNYLFTDSTNTTQAYAQYDWALSPDLTLSPGLRHSSTARVMDAPISKATPAESQYASATYAAWLPSLSLHDKLSPHWSAYAQAAKGYLAPPVAVIQTNGGESLKPEITTNYQLGTAYSTAQFTFGADLYYIDFSNYIGTATVTTDSGSESAYVNAGGAVYKGIEIEGTVALTPQLSVYANTGFNLANYKNGHVQVAATPKVTATLGLVYGARQGVFGSLMNKFVSSQYGVDNDTDSAGNTVFANSQHIGGYASSDAALGYRSEQGPWGMKGFSISVDVNNILNARHVTAYAGDQSVSGTPLYFGLPGRGIFVDFSMKI